MTLSLQSPTALPATFPPAPSFLGLPPELRLRIYDIVLHTIDTCFTIGRDNALLPTIFTLNRQIRTESSSHQRKFWSSRTFIYHSTWIPTFGFDTLVAFLRRLPHSTRLQLRTLQVSVDAWTMHNLPAKTHPFVEWKKSMEGLVDMFRDEPELLKGRGALCFVDLRSRGYNTRSPQYGEIVANIHERIRLARGEGSLSRQ